MSTETTPPTAKDPISIARRRKQLVHIVDPSKKIPLAIHLITQGEWSQVLVFSGTKKAADELVKSLESAGVSAAAVHGNTGEDKRTEALNAFNEGTLRVMVSTDMIAKSMNLGDVAQVISLGLPVEPELYLERIGYLGESGRAIALVASDEFNALYALERTLKRSIPQESIEGFTVVAETKEKPWLSKKPSRDEGQRRDERKPSGNRDGKKTYEKRDGKSFSKDNKKPYEKRDGKPHSKDGKKPYPKDGRSSSGKKSGSAPVKKTGKTIRIKSLKPSEEEK